MTATDELRRLLDGRGVEWTEPNNEARSHTTYWTAGALRCMAVEFTDGVVSIASSSHDLTPEQAIEATLGRGTCEMEYVPDWMGWHCKSCDNLRQGLRDQKPRYCPNCGRKVMA